MSLFFIITALITMASAIAAMTLRNLVHCVLCLTVTFAGIALVFLQLGAEFIGFSQILVYIGAVSILMLFALLMTRGGTELTLKRWDPVHWITGTLIGIAGFGVMSFAIFNSSLRQSKIPEAKADSLHALGNSLLSQYVLPLEVMALLLTVALIGAALIALPEKNVFRKNASFSKNQESGNK
ncbi:MAG: NADH-quinone oxidoreductase subunit J [Verrucomicrobia bacterium]|jgi:NADH-quinone oxidoreductase subunit J|nr:NADH-quinone oxidoreductase subunit J [Verrucomicrobiota bacterium]MBT5063095.1 NADH-quinone oxidoreductase subunit J [Verrucomicrobiota bacterium]MBT5480397.1 NADH-quinone oxidoreductase subunit J [Verrucomicrobiota bacterium]MBT6239112.1 NADH-quinone oxidoreductase subunit J [Verrucomicrobiota bacterium]MBT6804016.1 NADH-quinone oxidoreductase subunit J [Verrucomicrobiota bacterium]